MQRALLQYKRKENQPLVREALRIAGREDLIGYGRDCLVWPARRPAQRPAQKPAQHRARRQAKRR